MLNRELGTGFVVDVDGRRAVGPGPGADRDADAGRSGDDGTVPALNLSVASSEELPTEIGLYSTAPADDADLRAHIVADLAAQHNFLGYPADCLEVARFGWADERIGPAGAGVAGDGEGEGLRAAG